MPIPARPTLTAEDLIASRTLFSKIFQGIFPFTSINFYLPDSPQSVLSWRESISLEEFSDLNREAKEGVTYDPIRKRLFCHLFFNGQSLGFLVFFGFSRHCSPEDIALMNHLVKIGLEMTILQKQTQLDPATGLYLEWAFRKRALRQWKQWIKKEEESAKKPEKLSLAEAPSQETLVFGLLSIRPKPVPSEGSFSEKEWKIWIKEIRKTFPEETIWAVIDHYPLTLAFYVPLFPGKETAFLSNASLKTLAFTSETMIHLGWAALDLHRPESVQGSLSAFSLLNHCWEQAETALKMSRSMIDSCAFNYHDLLYRAGRVIDLLPGHRLVINLGHTAGVTAFMRFSVNNGDPERQEKALTIPLDIQEDLSICEVIYLHETIKPIQKNDRVRLISRPLTQLEETADETFTLQASDSFFQQFQQKLREGLKTTDIFSLVIGRVDNYAERLTLWNQQGIDEIQKELYRLIQENLPAEGLVGPYGRDGLILFLPAVQQEEARTWTLEILRLINRNLHLSMSFALADYPFPPFHKAEILDNAVKALDHLSFLGPGSVVRFDAVSLNISGDKLYNSGDLTGAVAEYERALLLDPNSTNVLNSLGVCYAMLGQTDRAMETFFRVLETTPDDFMASFNLGFAYHRLGMIDKTLSIWDPLARKNPPPFDLAYQLGRLYREQGNHQQAYSWFKKAEEASDRKDFIYRLLGESQERLGKRREAMGYFKKALKINPHDAFSLSHLGNLYLQRGESIQVALSLCQQAARLDPQKGSYWIPLGKAFLMNRVPQKALGALQQALSRGEQSEEVFLLLGQASRALENPEESRKYFIEALKRDPENPEIQGYLNEFEESDD